MKRLFVAAALAANSCACAANRGADASGHFAGETWSRAWNRFGSDSSQWIAPAVLTVATPIVWAFDKDISEDSLSEDLFNSNTQYGDVIAIGLGVVPLVFGGIEAISGDSRSLEVSSESLALTMAASYMLKGLVNKERPDGSGQDSFPSAHTSFAFAGATLIAREVRRCYGNWWGYLAYVPASYVGISRLEGQRHYLADITFGAALGMLITNLVYDAHFDEDGQGGIFGTDRGARVVVDPSPDGGGVMVGVQWNF